MDKREKRRNILRGAKYTLIVSLIGALILAVLSLIYSFIKPSPVIKNIYTAFYYFGAFVLLIAVPQLYKRDEDPKTRRVRRLSPLYGFYDIFKNEYTEKAMLESFEEFRGEGFWNGIFIVQFSITLLFLGFLLENIYWYVYI